MQTAVRLGASLIWMTLALLPGCGDSVTPPEDQLNLLLVTLDTTRADRIGCYGYEPALTPAIDSLAASGVRFDSAYCQVPLTLPSHVSLLTGTYPAVNGIRVNGGGILGEATPSMAEVFREHGYRTGAFTSIVVLHSHYGLDRGFDVYDNPISPEQFRSTTRPSSVRPGNETCDRALAWLNESQAKPFFAWVHFFDPHLPLNPPAPFDAKLSDPYDGEIAFVDSQIARLINWLDQSGLRERTLVVITADHGEALGEHGEDEHGLFLYSTTTRVPLIFSAPGKLPASSVVDGPVGLVSLLPTVLEFMEWDVNFELNGSSFADAWSDTTWQAEPSYCETEYPRLGYGWSATQSIITDDWLFIESPKQELYDRRSDRNEQVNVIGDHADVAARLSDQLAALKADMQPRATSSATLTSAEQSALEGIGYVQTTSPDNAPEAGRDPKDMVAVSNDYLRALLLIRKGDRAGAKPILERLATESPESDAIHGTLGNIYYRQSQYARAAREFEFSLRTDPDHAGRLSSLGNALLRQNKIEEAAAAFERAIKSDPNFGQAHGMLGTLAIQKGDFGRARLHFEAYVRSDPSSTFALVSVANLQMQQGEFSAAADGLFHAVELDPECIQAHIGLSQAVRAKGTTRAKAIAALRKSRQLKPSNRALASRLAWALATDARATAEQKAEALELAKRGATFPDDNWFSYDALSVAFAAIGDYGQAISEATRALELCRTQEPRAAKSVELRLQSFRANKPYFE